MITINQGDRKQNRLISSQIFPKADSFLSPFWFIYTLYIYVSVSNFLSSSCVKRFTRYGHYSREVEDIIIDSQLHPKSLYQKLEHLVAVDDPMLKSSWLCCWHTV